MKHTCIAHPTGGQLVIIRDWQTDFCAPLGPSARVGAAILSYFEYLTNACIANERSTFFRKTVNEILSGVMNIGSHMSIKNALTFLEQSGAVKIRRTADGLNRFNEYQLQINFLNQWLKTRELNLAHVGQIQLTINNNNTTTKEEVYNINCELNLADVSQIQPTEEIEIVEIQTEEEFLPRAENDQKKFAPGGIESTAASLDKWAAQLQSDEMFWDNAPLAFRFTKEVGMPLIPVFVATKRTTGDVLLSYTNFRKNFAYWAKKYLQNNSNEQRNKANDAIAAEINRSKQVGLPAELGSIDWGS